MTNIIMFLACSLCGFAVGKYFEKRIKRKGEFYTELLRYLSLLKVNVRSRKLELSQFNGEFCSQGGSLFSEYLLQGNLRCSLGADQRTNLQRFFDNLSCASSEALEKHIDYYSEIFVSDSKKISSEVASASLYSKLGLLLGMVVGILLM